MKILKRIKRIACSPKLRGHHESGTNNLPPILFHSIHGENVRISPDCTVAQRSDSFCKGICFSNRPIRVNERVCIKFKDISQSWSGAIRFGFTSNDPLTYRSSLPKYVCPDLTNKPGNWAKALGERFAVKDYILYFYYNELGDVHYGINGEERGIFFSGVSSNCSLWALIDIYGNTVEIESVDPRQQISCRRNSLEVDTIIPSLSTIDINRENREPLPQVYRDTHFQSFPFHKTKGCNIRLSNDRCIAERNNSHYCQGYVFSERPLRLGQKMVLQVLQTDELYAGSLAFGLTTCDPSTINSNDLPEDPHLLLDRSEYWVVVKDVANAPQAGDELAIRMTQNGEVQLMKNRQPVHTLMHVDSTQTMWPFFDLYGSTIKMKVLGICDNETPENIGNSAQVCNSRNNQQMSRSLNTNNNNNSSNLTVRMPNNSPKLTNTNNNSNSDSLNAIGNECNVCYEQTINSVLYTCGHVCMCYECAVKQWRGPGQCPICRATIRDVIRTYWS
ncbi:protein neuralized-like isoform X2 [Oppia nitens]|uniref:protein neuralized-like isoform X2 n=1 Tax=Oppia nitens TaxID=1686743 RepID=UPI0023DBECAF|nr:protein neuralized-like isoform X2 [Oppia nitens]